MEKFSGLSQPEAEKLLARHGYNEIADVAKASAFKIFLRQAKNNYIIYLLAFAAVLAFWVGKGITGYTIIGVITMVVGVGFFQEYRAEKAIAALKSMIMPRSVVIRDGREYDVPSRELVTGDTVVLGNGERVPADCRILWSSELRLDEAILTGESMEIKKGKDEEIFMGTFVINGRCVARVEQTGMGTKFGQIARMISTAEKELPLAAKVNKISKYMAGVAVVVSVTTGGLMIIRSGGLDGSNLPEILMLVVALSVSAFPEGFPVVLITTLASGAARMAKRNAIVNRMSIIETLGETTVICTDKTGTVTAGEMTVNEIVCPDGDFEVSGSGYLGEGEFFRDNAKIIPETNETLKQLLVAAVVGNDARIERTGEDGQLRVLGTPTEGALLVAGAKAGYFREELGYERLAEIPFSSERKMMSVLVEKDNEVTVFAKGAAEILVQKCDRVRMGGESRRMTHKIREEILARNSEMTRRSLRTLGVAVGQTEMTDQGYIEENLEWLGIMGMEDPPRPEVEGAIEICRKAGVTVKMITGDNPETAMSVATEIGLGGNLAQGQDLDGLSDSELEEVVRRTTVFARVKPEHKLRIVRALKRMGEIVTMTGDGVNDAPALKEAHIGVAMGLKGTDVSRSVADMTLKDDNFATIVMAVAEGRTIFNNIRKFVSYQLSVNAAELLVIFAGVAMAPVFGWPIPLILAIQILFMNLVTDNLPAITLGLNSGSEDILETPPRRGAQILNRGMVGLVVFSGMVMAVMTLAVYTLEFNVFGQDAATARTAALVTMIGLEITYAFSFRSFRKKILGRPISTNPYLVYASLISVTATMAVVYTSWGNRIFETVPLSLKALWPVLAGSVTAVVIFDLLKSYCNRRGVWLAKLVH